MGRVRCPGCGIDAAAGTRCGRCHTWLPAEAAAATRPEDAAFPPALTEADPPNPPAPPNPAGRVDPAGTRPDGPWPPESGRLPWPQPPRARRRPRVSGYVGWVLAAWVVTTAAGVLIAARMTGGDASPARAPSAAVRADTSPPPTAPGEGPALRRYWVDTFRDAEGFREPGGDGAAAGLLRAGTHYVFCKVRGPRVERGDAHNHWWLLTDLDEVYAGGGPRAYVPALFLTHWGDDEARDNEGADIPVCRS